jgi:hypothetical protein
LIHSHTQKKLKAAGATEALAEAIASEHTHIDTSNLATKDDLNAVKVDLNGIKRDLKWIMLIGGVIAATTVIPLLQSS